MMIQICSQPSITSAPHLQETSEQMEARLKVDYNQKFRRLATHLSLPDNSFIEDDDDD